MLLLLASFPLFIAIVPIYIVFSASFRNYLYITHIISYMDLLVGHLILPYS